MPRLAMRNHQRFVFAASGGSGGPPAVTGGTLGAVVSHAADALETVRAYSRLQASLIAAWRATFGVTDDFWFSFRRSPQRGEVELLGQMWTFGRHGAGVCFESADQTVVEAHDVIFEAPAGGDAWRIHVFCESRGITSLTFAGHSFDAGDHHRVHELLRQLLAAGVLVLAETDRERYVPTSP